MRIAMVTKLWDATSPFSVGGTGAAVGILTEELVKRGHDVTLFATGDSKTTAKLVSVKDTPWGANYSEPIEYLNIAQAFSKKYKDAFDIIDCHVEEKACFFADSSDTPTLINVTYDPAGDPKKVFEHYKHLNYVAISHELKKELPSVNWVDMIYHGIDVSLFPFNEKPKMGDEEYLLFIGRMSPQKGPDTAIRVAKKLGKKLILAGSVVEADKTYLDEKVWPFVDGTMIKYVGVVDFKQKIELYKNAVAMLHPIAYCEAFGLTLIESMACGTPVISYDNGAPREIIEEGKTGFVAQDEQSFIDAVEKSFLLNRKDCRDHVEKNFSAKKMVDQYEKLYQKILSEKPRKG